MKRRGASPPRRGANNKQKQSAITYSLVAMTRIDFRQSFTPRNAKKSSASAEPDGGRGNRNRCSVWYIGRIFIALFVNSDRRKPSKLNLSEPMPAMN